MCIRDRSKDAAIRAYLAELRVTQGEFAGKPFELIGWQRRFLRGAFKPHVKEAALTMGRGGGKTTFIAGIGLAHLEADGVKEPGAEITIVASSLGQGQIIFDHVLRFLGFRIATFAKKHTEQRMQLRAPDTTMLRVVGSNPGGLHGAAPSLIIADEIAQWPHNKSPRMLAALRTGLGKIPNSRMLMLGTRADRPDSPFEKGIRQADYSQSYAAGPNDPVFQMRTWQKANPSLRHKWFGTLREAYRADAAKAKQDAEMMQAFKALRLNMGVSDVTHEYVLDVDAFKRTIVPAKYHAIERPYILGIDLGTTAAMSGVAAYSLPTRCLDVRAAFPQLPDLHKRELQDGVAGLYRRMLARGELFLFGQYVVSIAELIDFAVQTWGRPHAIVIDRWREGELREALSAISFPFTQLITRGQGYKDGSEDVRLFRSAALTQNIFTRESLLLTSAISEARTVSDPAGNTKLSKNTEGGRRSRGRDDALAAAIIAVAEGVRQDSQLTQATSLYLGKV